MDQALKSLIASEEEVVTSLGLSRQWHLFLTSLLTSAQHLRLPSRSCSRDWGWGRGYGFQTQPVTLTTWLFSFLLHPSPTVPPLHPPPLSHLTVPSRSILPHTPAVNVGT